MSLLSTLHLIDEIMPNIYFFIFKENLKQVIKTKMFPHFERLVDKGKS